MRWSTETHREEHEHARARDAAKGLVDLPPPAVGLVDVEEEREPIDAPIVAAHELAVLVHRVVPQLLAQPDQDHGEEQGHPNRPGEDRHERKLFEEGIPVILARDREVRSEERASVVEVLAAEDREDGGRGDREHRVEDEQRQAGRALGREGEVEAPPAEVV